ncbi:MAG: Segregation and condensation protein A [Candidatus Moranbacteria bacterium GW2011_GWE1_49_15]|nr:MAG: Segregation and condensation protein A [Candidatus Moranbacteria bacterium GW2011_GWE2_47_10]KKW07611.1 MAG: Segregation and condensation protein A [Candidatus Moranbacteria bacterium GW2011_GWE1_49_15]HBP01055.1 hypothetical protein [Candidatus Moranbacteria bacterium]
MTYNIRIEQFEGPLDLLLQLIEQDKLDITRVSLSRVADQYLEYIGNRENISLENLSQFLSVASKLILIKSKALLPLLRFSEEEEEEIKDLEHQLAEYRKFKDISLKIAELVDANRVCFSRDSYVGFESVFCPPEKISGADLEKSFGKVLGGIPILEKLEEEVVKEVLTLEDRIMHLQDTLRRKVVSTFSEMVAASNDRIEVVVSFLALLELVKQKVVHVEQEGIFQEIKMRHSERN